MVMCDLVIKDIIVLVNVQRADSRSERKGGTIELTSLCYLFSNCSCVNTYLFSLVVCALQNPLICAFRKLPFSFCLGLFRFIPHTSEGEILMTFQRVRKTVLVIRSHVLQPQNTLIS